MILAVEGGHPTRTCIDGIDLACDFSMYIENRDLMRDMSVLSKNGRIPLR